ncbi:MAG: family 16 glycosylhydrolase [Draconibacterium sp.]
MFRKILIILVLITPYFAGAQKYVMVWSDEFNTPGLPDSTRWSYEKGKLRNNELQYYTEKRLENARIEDTVLVIEARKENFAGSQYTSASLISKGIGDWKYGKIEISAKVPTGKGTWPALWMMPTNSEYGGWPRSGEIDIMEYVGYQPAYLYYTCHFEGTNGTGHQQSGISNSQIANPFNKFIKFGIVWTPEKIEWYANDVKYFTYTKKADDYRTWPFNKEFYLIMNLAYGGSWGGSAGVDDTKLPHKFLIDYVRVYQLQETEGPFSLTILPANHGSIEISPAMDLYPENTKITLTAVPDSGYQFKAWEYQSGANPFTLTVNKKTVVNPIFFNPSELLSNSEFDQTINPWSFYVENSQNSTYLAKTEDSVFVIDITKSPGTDWKLGFQESGLSMEKASYKLRFDAWAQNPNTVAITVSKNYSDWGALVSKSASILSTKKSFELDITMPKADDNVRLYFGIGRFIGKVYFDNISLTKVTNPTGIADLKKDNNTFSVYPNPTSGKFRIKIATEIFRPESKIEMFSSDGRPVFTQFLLEDNSEINPGKLPPGFYLLKITAGEKNFAKSLIVQ